MQTRFLKGLRGPFLRLFLPEAKLKGGQNQKPKANSKQPNSQKPKAKQPKAKQPNSQKPNSQTAKQPATLETRYSTRRHIMLHGAAWCKSFRLRPPGGRRLHGAIFCTTLHHGALLLLELSRELVATPQHVRLLYSRGQAAVPGLSLFDYPRARAHAASSVNCS